jgi:iron complex outermembrane receptor protein
MGALEYRPSDSYSTILDVYYSKFDKEEFKRGMEFGLVWGSAGNPVTSTVNPATGTTTSATFNNFRPVLRNDFNGAQDDLFALGWNQEFKFGDNWKLKTDLSYSDAKREERILETYAGLAPGLSDSIAIQFNPDGFFDFDFGLDYADPSILRLTDPGGWGQDGYIKDFEVNDSLKAVRVDLERSFDAGFISSVEFGFNVTDRKKSRASNENFLCLNVCRDGTVQTIPADLIGGEQGFAFAGLPGILGFDARRALGSLYDLPPNFNGDIANKNWRVDETVTTLFVQANIDTELGSVPVRGNVGVQVLDTDQSSDGFATYEGNPIGDPIAGGDDYREYLPSLNLIFSLPADQVVRFGAARQLARPRMDDLRASTGYGINRQGAPGFPGPFFSGGGGNPNLRPWIANALDVSYEKYFGGKGYFSAAYFHKDLRTYIFSQDVPFDFAGLAIPPGTPPEFIPTSTLGQVNAPANGEGGTLKGLEYAISVPLDMLWEPLEGFGLQASYTDSGTSIQPAGPETAGPLPGFSKYTSNATVYFEKYGFSARASRRSRSQFLGEVQGFGGDRTRIFFEGESVLDLQLGYVIQSGALKNLSILFQVSNLGDEPFRSNFDDIEDRPRQFFEYGRNYLFGVNYRF